MNGKLVDVYTILESKREQMEAERDALQHRRDAIGVEIADLNEAMRTVDRFLGRAEEGMSNPHRGKIVRMTPVEIAKVPVEREPSAAKERPGTITDCVLEAVQKGPCGMWELKDRVVAMIPDVRVSSVDTIAYALVKRGDISKRKDAEGRTEFFAAEG